MVGTKKYTFHQIGYILQEKRKNDGMSKADRLRYSKSDATIAAEAMRLSNKKHGHPINESGVKYVWNTYKDDAEYRSFTMPRRDSAPKFTFPKLTPPLQGLNELNTIPSPRFTSDPFQDITSLPYSQYVGLHSANPIPNPRMQAFASARGAMQYHPGRQFQQQGLQAFNPARSFGYGNQTTVPHTDITPSMPVYGARIGTFFPTQATFNFQNDQEQETWDTTATEQPKSEEVDCDVDFDSFINYEMPTDIDFAIAPEVIEANPFLAEYVDSEGNLLPTQQNGAIGNFPGNAAITAESRAHFQNQQAHSGMQFSSNMFGGNAIGGFDGLPSNNLYPRTARTPERFPVRVPSAMRNRSSPHQSQGSMVPRPKTPQQQLESLVGSPKIDASSWVPVVTSQEMASSNMPTAGTQNRKRKASESSQSEGRSRRKRVITPSQSTAPTSNGASFMSSGSAMSRPNSGMSSRPPMSRHSSGMYASVPMARYSPLMSSGSGSPMHPDMAHGAFGVSPQSTGFNALDGGRDTPPSRSNLRHVTYPDLPTPPRSAPPGVYPAQYNASQQQAISALPGVDPAEYIASLGQSSSALPGVHPTQNMASQQQSISALPGIHPAHYIANQGMSNSALPGGHPAQNMASQQQSNQGAASGPVIHQNDPYAILKYHRVVHGNLDLDSPPTRAEMNELYPELIVDLSQVPAWVGTYWSNKWFADDAARIAQAAGNAEGTVPQM